MAKDRGYYEDLNQLVKDLVLNAGAIDVGIVTTETLKGGPSSTDLSYVLDGARSAVVFALPLDQEKNDPSPNFGKPISRKSLFTKVGEVFFNFSRFSGLSYGVYCVLVLFVQRERTQVRHRKRQSGN